MTDQKIIVVLPTYNEQGNIAKMVMALDSLEIKPEILFIDDNSPDGSGQLINNTIFMREKSKSNIHAIHRERKSGIGSAHKLGLKWAYSNNYDLAITMDCDFLHSPKDIPRMLELIKESDFVTTTRFEDKNSLKEWSFNRKIITNIGHLLTKVLFGIPYDATGSFRIYNLKKINQKILDKIESNGYSFFFESLIIIHENGYKINQIPVILSNRKYGDSKLKLEDLINSFTFMVKLKWKIYMNKEKVMI